MRADLRWLAALGLLAACRLAPAAPFGAAELMQALAAVPAAEARFTEVRQMEVLRAPLELRGTLRYERPDRLERRVTSPYQEVTRIEGDRVSVDNPARGAPRIYSLASLPAALALVEGLRATLAGDLATLERHYRVSLEGRPEAWTLKLAPRALALSGPVAEIRLSGSAARLERMEIDDRSGDRTIMTLSDRQP